MLPVEALQERVPIEVRHEPGPFTLLELVDETLLLRILNLGLALRRWVNLPHQKEGAGPHLPNEFAEDPQRTEEIAESVDDKACGALIMNVCDVNT
jgi:hypothetical protein